MNIALIAKLFAPVHLTSTGGTETFVFNLARELDRRGHQVTVFASGDSEIGGGVKLVPVVRKSYWRKYTENPEIFSSIFQSRLSTTEENVGYIKALFYLKQHCDEFDIIHDNSLYFLTLLLHNYLFSLPSVTTLHVPIEKFRFPEIANSLNISFEAKNYYIAISERQKELAKDLEIYDVNYNGIDVKRFQFNNQGGDSLIWIGRIVPEKGLKTAIEVANKTNLPLKIIGSVADQKYFDKEIQTKIDKSNQIEYLGEKTGGELVKIYQDAKILLFPIDWEEPFGLVLTEAMACGTPVVAFDRGAVSEIIKDGVTGFICPPNDVEAMVGAVKKIYDMPEAKYQWMRQNCRQHVEDNFTIKKMVNGYEEVYDRIIKDWHEKQI